MATLEQYRKNIQTLLQSYATYSQGEQDIDTQLVLDTTRDHYQLVNVGWQNERRIYGCIIHIDIKDGKIWIQHNGTEDDIAAELVEMGIPKTDIVIGFHSPFKRQFTEYAVN
ncbi:MAG: XisI protein [Leptolyngbya foveolarum]|uniref:XisI protein n=1 Tax=Leptolyngbya foveolarum TaxID=47253 RepID=A0A2W4VGB6_9CYAN|nr:MAG: XisI protein [Leptolyngbya foveolarum]